MSVFSCNCRCRYRQARSCARYRCAPRLAVAVAAIVVYVAALAIVVATVGAQSENVGGLERGAGEVMRAEGDNIVYRMLPVARCTYSRVASWCRMGSETLCGWECGE